MSESIPPPIDTAEKFGRKPERVERPPILELDEEGGHTPDGSASDAEKAEALRNTQEKYKGTPETKPSAEGKKEGAAEHKPGTVGEHAPKEHEEHTGAHGHTKSKFEKAKDEAARILSIPPKVYTKWVGLPAGVALALPGAGWALGNVYGGTLALLGHPGHFALAAKAGALFHTVLPFAGPLFAPLAAVGLMAAIPFVLPGLVSFVVDKINALVKSGGGSLAGGGGHGKSHSAKPAKGGGDHGHKAH